MLGFTHRRGRFALRTLGVAAAVAAGLIVGGTPVHADPVDDAEAEIEAEFHDLEAIIEDYNKVNEEFEDTKDKIDALEKELKPFEEKLDVLYARVADIVTAAYTGGKVASVSRMLTVGSPDILAEQMTLLDQLSAGDADAIAALNAAKAELDERKSVLDGLYASQSEREQELREKKETIEADIERLQDEREDAYRDSRGVGDDGFVPPYVPGERGEVVRFALKQVGDPYVWAAAGPDAWDCSGLTLGAWSQVGVALPHNAEAQWNQMTHISREQLQPGDLVFFNGLSHVAMYIGDGHVVQAAINYNNVAIETIESAASSYYGAARLPGW